MYDPKRSLAEGHLAEIQREAQQRHLGVVARCCRSTAGWFVRVKDRLLGHHG